MNTAKQRRRHKRFLCADLVELVWSDSRGRATRGIGNLENISEGGMCLQFEKPFDAGTRIRMPCARKVFHGIVRYVFHREDSYVIGVEFHKSSLWSTEFFVPRHLLDPSALKNAPRVRSIPGARWIN